jgi:NAD(P)-dependent dehydrogenase (short-subunit alcohol dehydrogenase family)
MGKLGRYSTGEEALEGADLIGKTAIVTGGNTGLGAETVRVLALAGARVIMTSRSVEKGQEEADRIKAGGVKVRTPMS